MFIRIQNERVQEKKLAEQEKADLHKRLMELQSQLIIAEKELDLKESKIQELQQKVDGFEKEKEDAFWDEKNSLDSGAKSDAKNKIGSEDLEKFYEFQKELEKTYEEVQTNQMDVQEKLNKFFSICPQIDEVKQAYSSEKFPLQSN